MSQFHVCLSINKSPDTCWSWPTLHFSVLWVAAALLWDQTRRVTHHYPGTSQSLGRPRHRLGTSLVITVCFLFLRSLLLHIFLLPTHQLQELTCCLLSPPLADQCSLQPSVVLMLWLIQYIWAPLLQAGAVGPLWSVTWCTLTSNNYFTIRWKIEVTPSLFLLQVIPGQRMSRRRLRICYLSELISHSSNVTD